MYRFYTSMIALFTTWINSFAGSHYTGAGTTRRRRYGCTLRRQLAGIVICQFLINVSFATPVPATLCTNVQAWPGGDSEEVVFTAVDAVAMGERGDGPNLPMPLSLTGDVLQLAATVLPPMTELLSAEGPVICVKYRPEWLGLQIRNSSDRPVHGLLTLHLPDGSVLEAKLPQLRSGEMKRVLVRASAPLASLPVDAVTLQQGE